MPGVFEIVEGLGGVVVVAEELAEADEGGDGFYVGLEGGFEEVDGFEVFVAEKVVDGLEER